MFKLQDDTHQRCSSNKSCCLTTPKKWMKSWSIMQLLMTQTKASCPTSNVEQAYLKSLLQKLFLNAGLQKIILEQSTSPCSVFAIHLNMTDVI